jgi:hypothetical protein
MPAGGASLRCVRGRDPFDSARSLVVEPGNHPTPPLTTNRAIECPLLRDPNTRVFNRATRRARHRPHVEVFHSNGVEPAPQIGRGLLDPVSSPVGLACFESRNRQPGARSAVGAAMGACEALLQPAQPDLLARCKARGMQQLSSGQSRRHRDTTIDTDHAGVPWSGDRVRNVGDGDMPAPSAIPRDAIGLRTSRHGPRPPESDPADLGHPHPPIVSVEHFDVVRFHPDLSKALMHNSLAPRWTAMSTSEEVLHGLGEVPQRLLLHGLRPGCQPAVFGADLSQLGRLLVVPRAATARPPKLRLFHGQIPHEPGMAAMLQQHQLLSRCRQQPEPRHTRNVTVDTDTSSRQCPHTSGSAFLPRHKRQAFQPKEWR